MAIFWIIILVVIFAIIALKLFSLLFSAMSKILIVVLVVFLVYTIAVNAERELVYQGYVFSDQSITIDDNAFIIQFGEGHPSSIQLNHQGNYFFIPKDMCKTVINADFCFFGSIFDTDFGKYKVNLSVYRVAPDMTLTRTIDNPLLAIGEEAEISANVTNGIGIPAENFEFIDSFSPDEFEITDISGNCEQEGSNIVYRGVLRENRVISCRYTIKALKEVQRSTKARISYFDGNEIKTIFSSEINFNVVPAFSLETYFNESDKKVPEGSRVLFVVNMTNNRQHDDIGNITLNISLPSGLKYDSTASFQVFFNATKNMTIPSQNVKRISDWILQFTGKLEKNSSKFIALSLIATKGGISNIFVDSSYAIEGESGILHSSGKKDTLDVEHREIAIFTNFNDGDSFDAGEQKLMKIGISNPNDAVILRNINVRVDTNLSNMSQGYITYLNSTNAVNAISQAVNMPYAASDTAYPFNIIVSYDTDYGEHFSETREFDFVVKPIAGLSVSHDISKTTVESKEQFSVRTLVKNERNVDIKNVRVFDVVPMDFSREGLNSISNLNINENDEVAAYEYKMTAPEVAKSLTYFFRTTALYSEGNRTFAFESPFEITVIPKQKDLSIARAISDSKPSRGAIVDILYTISNPDDKETLKNIEMHFPLQQDIDLVGQKNFTIERLLPGESYTVRDAHRARPKLNGSLTLNPTSFAYRDEEGNVFVKNSSDTSFSADYGYISGPAFYVEKKSNSTVLVGDWISIALSVQNIGSEAGSVDIADSGNRWSLQMNPGESDLITYKFKAEKEGLAVFRPAEAQYSYRGRDVFTISNEAETNVTVLKEEKPAEEKAIQEVKVEKVAPAPEKKTFLQMIWETIASIFNILRK